MEYNVIIMLDEKRNKRYYYSYVDKGGNIKCADLPPYQDINKARSCYWDAENTTWVYDADKYAEIVAEQEAQRSVAEKMQREEEATPTNEELASAMMEIADNVNTLMDAVAELGSVMKGGE